MFYLFGRVYLDRICCRRIIAAAEDFLILLVIRHALVNNADGWSVGQRDLGIIATFWSWRCWLVLSQRHRIVVAGVAVVFGR